MDMSLSKLLETVNDREAWRAAVHRVAKESDITEQLNDNETQLGEPDIHFGFSLSHWRNQLSAQESPLGLVLCQPGGSTIYPICSHSSYPSNGIHICLCSTWGASPIIPMYQDFQCVHKQFLVVLGRELRSGITCITKMMTSLSQLACTLLSLWEDKSQWVAEHFQSSSIQIPLTS